MNLVGIAACLLAMAVPPARAATISTLAGTGTGGYNGDGIAATTAELDYPAGVAVDAAGNVFIADRDNQRIRRVDAATGQIADIAGTGSAGYNFDGIAATLAQLNYPQGVAVDTAGDVYVADTVNNLIRKFTPGGNISTVAGTGFWGYNGDNIDATTAWLMNPTGVAVDAAGNIYIAEFAGMRIRKVRASDGKIFTVAGTGTIPGDYNGDGIPATTAKLNFPQGVAVDAAGNIYIADRDNQRVRKVEVATGNIVTVAGTGSAGYNGDGIPASGARVNSPAGVAVDSAGNIFIADRDNERVRKVDAATGIITTVAGSGTRGDSGENIDALAAEMYGPSGVAVHPSGRFHIADYNNHRIRAVLPVSVVLQKTAAAGPVCPGSALTYTVSWSNAGWATAYGLTLTDTVPNGIAWAAPSLEFWVQADGAGVPALTASAYAASAAGPWTPGEPPDGAGAPVVCRWVVARVAPGASGFLRHRVTLSATLANGDLVGGGTSGTVAADSRGIAAATAPTAVGKAVLAASASAPASVSQGQTFAVVLTVTNTGAIPAASVLPSAAIGPGGASAAFTGGPVPAGPVAVPPGGSASFTWSCSATGAGAVVFTVTAVGTTCGGMPVSSSAHAPATVQARAMLVSTGVSVVPSSAKVGQQILVVFGLSNTGGAGATVVPGPAAACSPPGGAQWVSGPVPAGPVPVAGGSGAAFTWTYRLAAAGWLGFSVTVSGSDANSGDPVMAAGTSWSVTAFSGAALVSTATALPASVRQGGVFTLSFVVRNTGDRPVTAASVHLSPAVPSTVQVLSSPIPSTAISLAAGTSTGFTWQVKALAEGVLGLTASATGQDASDLSYLGTQAGASVTVLTAMPRVEAGSLTVAPNRLDRSGPAAGVKIGLRGNPGGTAAVEIYNEAGWRIRSLEARLDAGGEAVVVFDGTDGSGRRLAAGLYWVAVTGGGAKGRKPLFIVNGGGQ